MVLNSGKELGKTIASQQKQIDSLKQEISPNDPSASFPLFTIDSIKLEGTWEVYKRRMSGIFIVANPIYGLVEGSAATISIPITVPLAFTGGVSAYPIGPFCILDHPIWANLDDCLLGDRDIDQYERTLLDSGIL